MQKQKKDFLLKIILVLLSFTCLADAEEQDNRPAIQNKSQQTWKIRIENDKSYVDKPECKKMYLEDCPIKKDELFHIQYTDALAQADDIWLFDSKGKWIKLHWTDGIDKYDLHWVDSGTNAIILNKPTYGSLTITGDFLED